MKKKIALLLILGLIVATSGMTVLAADAPITSHEFARRLMLGWLCIEVPVDFSYAEMAGILDDNGIDIYSTWKFRKSYHLIGSFSLDQSALAEADESYQERYTASAKFLETRRQTVDPMRVTQLGFRLTNSNIDENGGIHGLWVHVTKIGPKGIRQE